MEHCSLLTVNSLTMNNSSSILKYGALPAVLLFLHLLQISVSDAILFDDTPVANDLSTTKVFVPQIDADTPTVTTTALQYDDLAWSIKSRGLRVGEITKKVSNKKDSMGKLVKGTEEGEEGAQENKKVKSMLGSKLHKGNDDMKTAKKIKGASLLLVVWPMITFKAKTNMHCFSTNNFPSQSSGWTSRSCSGHNTDKRFSS